MHPTSQLNMVFLVAVNAFAFEHNALLGTPTRGVNTNTPINDFPSLANSYNEAKNRLSSQSQQIVKNNYPTMIYRDNHMTYVS